MRSKTTEGVHPSPGAERRTPSRGRSVLVAAAGPALIIAGTLVVLWRFVSGSVFPQHPDILRYWLPSFCFLGRSLASGHIPAWNPYTLGGAPFAADPQSGWMNLPAMAIFTALPCGPALRVYLIAQPILAGIGMYWFLRSEGVSRPSATVGGLALALPVAGSRWFEVPWLSGSLAWTSLLLAAASRHLRSERWPGRLLWTAAAALAWGQLAAAHFSVGLAIGTLALLTFCAAKLFVHAPAGTGRIPRGLMLLGVLAVSLVALNLGFLLPRLAYLGRTTMGLGYRRLDAITMQLSGGLYTGGALMGPPRFAVGWPLLFGMSPGVHVGAAALAVAFAGWWSRRHRWLASSFGLLGALFYVLTLPLVVRALTPIARHSRLGDVYLHGADELQFGVLLCLSVLAGVGMESWREAHSLTRRLVMLAGVLVWGALASIVALDWSRQVLLGAGAVATGLAFAAGSRRPRLFAVVPMVLAAELIVNGLAGYPPFRSPDTASQAATVMWPPDMSRFDLDGFLRAGSIARTLQATGGRYVSLDPRAWNTPASYSRLQGSAYWGLLGAGQSTLFRLEEAQGFNPIQLARPWTFVRAVDPENRLYTASYFKRTPTVALDLLGVGYVIQPLQQGLLISDEIPVSQQGQWVLYEIPHALPRATVVPTWSVAGSPEAALTAVLEPGFVPADRAVVEGQPNLASSGPAGGRRSAVYRATGLGSAVVDVEASQSSIVVVRNSYDPDWHATVDGRRVPILPADYVDQGIPVPPGRHTILLTYNDPWIGLGLIGSGVSLAILLGLAVLLRRHGMGATRQDVLSSTAVEDSS